MTALVAQTAPAALDRAYAACARLAREHYENFPVASVLLPRRMRPAIAAIYAFARRADDFADEPGYTDDERLRLLDGWSARLHGGGVQPGGGTNETDDLIFAALGDTIRAHGLPLSLFEDLLSAFRQDVTVSRYRSWNDVLDYCARSANPVGRLVLRVAGCATPSLDRASDCLCTALQLTNFWQDLARDWARGRLYVPQADLDAAGAREADLDRGRITPQWADVLGGLGARTRQLFVEGRPVCDGVGGRLALELRLTWLGGMRILERLERHGYDVFQHRPALSAADAGPLLWRALAWQRT